MQDYLDRVEKQLHDAIDTGDTEAILRLGAILNHADQARDTRLAATTLGEAALWYAEHGIDVFPLQPGGKLPATKHGFKDATTNPEQIRAWWTGNPGANIGAPTGHTFDVIDIDGAAGIQSWIQHHDELAAISIGHVTTPRPGGNHLYIPPRGEKNRAGLYPGVDYRGAGGYVVIPPSVGANGIRYRWIRQLQGVA